VSWATRDAAWHGGPPAATTCRRSAGRDARSADEQQEDRYVVGRRLDGRSGDRVTVRPAPPRPHVRRSADLPPLPPRRSARPAGPLVASPAPAPRVRTLPDREPAGRFRRFARRYGWRAYAVPVLAVATVVTLADLALTTPSETRSADSGTSASAPPAASSPVEAPVVETPASVVPGPTASAEADAGPTAAPPPTAEQYVEQGAGTVTVVDGTSAVLGAGPLRRFAVEVENGIRVDARAFAAAVEQTLGDPRSWGADGRMSFQRVGRAAARAGQYDFKVSLISPGSMETYCPGVGTGGYTSCRYGERAVINLARWATAVPHYDGDVATYRHYVVNHEVGHALGNGHVDCPGTGQVAPVMLQQTLGLEGCVKNAWPHP
jgi:hypothetical protein